ncbi:carboxypeptidase regulatory-like domain-containing protein [Pyxidicoccus xibeiensis]|uniref:carboxypeptidase regulatory-like domain-containing protein n=1 Tax=Pyxidicoccus xibeiensis TaxID=2906759 RepID=UPI0020A721FB|nr:carboxypeptidase regulatory-like domain-containing protein [Pyxidicoccus xibeiensis]MCP3136912.1 carboxypeptidase regulatory-like domain-containing protein [Pyxidicoccus xibeiensis]
MRKGMTVAVAVLAIALGLGALLSRKQEPSSRPERPSRSATRTGTGFILPPAVPLPDGNLRIRGVLLGDGGPLAGVRLSATRPEAGHTLSELSCGDVLQRPEWKEPLQKCLSKAAGPLLEFVIAREGEAPVYAETVTESDGTFTLEGLPPGSFALWAMDARGAGMWPEVPAGTEGLTRVLGAGVTVEGRVSSEDGAPLAGVQVTAVHTGHTRFFDTETGADGRYRLGPLPLAEYRTAFSKEGWLPQLGKGAEHEQVTLHRPRRLVGRVLGEGRPAPGVRVQAERLGKPTGDDRQDSTLEQVATTDAEGRFTFEALGTAAYRLSATLGDRHAFAQVEQDALPSEVILELGSALRVEGTVRDAAGTPVPGARVYATQHEALTDAAGHYALGPMEPGRHRVRVSVPRYLFASEVVESGPGNARVDFTLESSVPIEGVVVDGEGHPVAGVALELKQYFEDGDGETYSVGFGFSDEEGHFVLEAPAPGEFSLEVTAKERRVREHLFVTAPSKDVRVVLPRKARVSGTLTDEHGVPFPGATVALWRAEGAAAAEGEDLRALWRAEGATGAEDEDLTDARGHFSLWGLEPGRFVLEATHVSGGVERSTSRPVELRENEALEVSLRLESGWTLTGLAVDAQGQPVSGVQIFPLPPQHAEPTWRRAAETVGLPPSALTGTDGRFTLRHLAGDEVWLEVRADDHRFVAARSTGGQPQLQRLHVLAGGGEVRLFLERLGHIHGRLTGPDGAPITRFRLNGKDLADPRGAFSRPVETSGTWRMELSAKGMAPVLREVEVSAGMDVDLGEIRISPGRRVQGRVLDATTSEPVVGASVLATPARIATLPIENHRDVVRTDASGAFTLPHVEAGPLPLFVEADGYRPGRIELGTDAAEDLTVLLVQGARVEFSIQDAQGKPMTAHVYLDRQGELLTARPYAVPGGSGVVQDVEPGDYRVLAFVPGPRRGSVVFEPRHVQVPAQGAVRVDLTARRTGATLELRVDDSVGFAVLYPGVAPPPRLFRDFPPVEARSFPYEGALPGDVTFRNLPPGRATLFLVERSLQGVHREELDVPAGGTLVRDVTPAWTPFVFGGF